MVMIFLCSFYCFTNLLFLWSVVSGGYATGYYSYKVFCYFILFFSCFFMFLFVLLLFLSPSLFCFGGGGGGWGRNARGRRVEVGRVPNVLITQISFKLPLYLSPLLLLYVALFKLCCLYQFSCKNSIKTWFSNVRRGRNCYIMSPLLWLRYTFSWGFHSSDSL